jgi:hypothetical protein
VVQRPPIGSFPHHHLPVPCRPGTLVYKIQVKTKSGTCNHAPPRVSQHRNMPPNRGGIRGCHMSSGSGAPPPPEREGSGATMCTIASDPLGELRCATCPEASDPASLRGGLRAPVMPVIPYGPHASNMKKSLAGLPVQQGSLVPNAHMHISRHLTSRPSCACKTCG